MQGVLHMTCTQCGQTFHLSEQTAARLTAQLDEREGFSLDCGETVLFGVCRNCRK